VVAGQYGAQRGEQSERRNRTDLDEERQETGEGIDGDRQSNGERVGEVTVWQTRIGLQRRQDAIGQRVDPTDHQNEEREVETSTAFIDDSDVGTVSTTLLQVEYNQ